MHFLINTVFSATLYEMNEVLRLNIMSKFFIYFCVLILNFAYVLTEKTSNVTSRNVQEMLREYTLTPDYKIELNMNNPRQNITSPGFPYEDYLPNTHVIYEVEIKLDDAVKQLSNRILLTFEMFSVQESDFCTKDGLEIKDVSDQIRVYCGVQVGRTILSEGSKLYIRFFSDSSIESRGYSILLEMYNTGCSKHFENVESGTFTSPNHPGRYYADDLCVWKIDAPEGKRIFVKFSDVFDVRAYEPLCVQDYLAVSLTGDFDTHVKRYCHGKKPVEMYSSRNSLLFMFSTDCCFEGKGFSATFTVVDEDAVTTTPSPQPLPQMCACGTENLEDERILGGKTVSPPHRYPWMVALVKTLRNNKDDYYCGGALINRQYVLTAAHCIERENVSETRIAIEVHDTASNPKTIQASEFILHPKFTNKVYFNDIALIKLQDAVDFNARISPICLPNQDDIAPEGTVAVVAGWGRQSFETSTLDTNLQEVDVPVVSNPKCVARYGGVVLDTNICAGGEKEKDACGGDSGGPLFSKYDGKWYAIGVVSWGVSCGREDYPGVYTRVSEYLQWIQDNSKDAPPCDDEVVQPPVKPNLDNCGIPNESSTYRIVGGTEATPFEFPWMAMIVYERRVIGAGALISPYYVISAASTFDNVMEWYPELVDVFLGRHTVSKSTDTSKRYRAKSIHRHPRYGVPSPYNNDVALLKLDVAEEGVPGLYKPICLPRSDAFYAPDLSLTTAGWGSTSSSGDGSDVLRKVDLNMWSEEQCEERYPGWFTATMICAYKQGADTCHGDSGAPLMRLYYGRYYLAGLSSWASKDGCSVRNAPRVFAAVHANLQWISQITGLDIQ